MRLSICAISYNEAEHIPFWYEQHKELADEFILVDTESTDGTIEVAKNFPIKIQQIKWQHHFGQAKNFAMKYASGDWILFLSPDLWIDKSNFQEIKNSIKDEKFVAYYLPIVHHFTDWKKEKKPATLDIPREKAHQEAKLLLFKNDPQIYWEHRVHESVKDSIERNFGLDRIGILKATIHHDSTNNELNNKVKLRYYWFLEDFSALERKIWEVAEELRNAAYKK